MPPTPDDKNRRPDWVPEGADPKVFASSVMRGVGGHGKAHEDAPPGPGTGKNEKISTKKRARRRGLSTEEYVEGIRAGNRAVMARAITLVESSAPAHVAQAQEVLQAVLPEAGRSIRVGITGVPGAGKSTFIERLGLDLCAAGHKVAVLAVDPTSSVTGGSVLGDKTRMEKLSRHEHAFIRPSPSGGTLGGLARKSRETILLCEAAGYDIVLVETVGVGQSETTVRSMTDVFLLLQIAGAGDELQGIKKGIMELADLIAVNKADGENLPRAKATRAELSRVVHYLQPATKGWQTEVLACSAMTGEGVAEVWQTIEQFRDVTRKSGVFAERRREQNVAWMQALLDEAVMALFREHPRVQKQLPLLKKEVAEGTKTSTQAVRELLEGFGGGA